VHGFVVKVAVPSKGGSNSEPVHEDDRIPGGNDGGLGKRIKAREALEGRNGKRIFTLRHEWGNQLGKLTEDKVRSRWLVLRRQ
jgi:hypothetical protein